MVNKLYVSVFLVAFSTLLTSSAQIFYKKGALKLPLIFSNWELLVGMAFYIVAAGILIYALKFGDLNVLYPIIATSFVWVVVFSYYIFNEPITGFKIAGVVSILFGISLIGAGSKKSGGDEWQRPSGQ